MTSGKSALLACLCGTMLVGPLHAAEVQTLEVVEVTGSAEDLLGSAESATQGTVTARQLENRPILRPGEVLEAVPGVIITQHSGDGKANQYFLRGFNLDHGTDLYTTVAGAPVNMPTHGHGQGYSDLNFLIPELVERMQYKKGPYFADEGDFSAAGAMHIDYYHTLKQGVGEIGAGEFGHRRGFVAASPKLGEGDLLYAVELFHNDGPWDNPEDYRKVNAVLRYSQGTAQNGFSLTAMAYRGKWNATDQVPVRALEQGLISRFGAIDPSDGGETHRYSVSGEWVRTRDDSITRANAYVIDYRLNLFSNFTYFLNDPVNGDQFEQADRRVVSGLEASHTQIGKWFERDTENTVGVRLRNDNIPDVGLFSTASRRRLAAVREDKVVQTSVSAYLQNLTQWAEKFRSVAGIRADFYDFAVNADNPANSGRGNDHIASPKLSLVFGPWSRTEYYLNLGYGFHSNDARGATITVDPATGNPAAKVPPLVRAKGRELGVRTALTPKLTSSLALWRLDLASELLFVGDAGTTEPSFPSRRSGIEWANRYTPYSWLALEMDLALSRARFSGNPAGDRIPGAIERTLSFGITADNLSGWYGGLQLRYFGPRPLLENDSVRSPSSTLVNLRGGYKINKQLRATLDVFNLFDRKASDIDYFYCSRLRGETPGVCGDGSAGVDDIHTHPAEPRSLRLSLLLNF